MMKSTLVWLCAWAAAWVSASPARADTSEPLAVAAGLYAKSAYADAELVLRRAVEEAPSDPTRLHALGLALAKQGKYGEATLSLRRALRLAPRDRAARLALEWVRAQTSATAFGGPAESLAQFFALVPREPALWIAGLLSLASSAWLTAARRRASSRRGAFLLAAGALLIAAVPLASLAVRATDVGGVILAPQVEVRSGPGNVDAVLFATHAGQEVACPQVLPGWTRIVLPTGASGWIPSASVEQLTPTP